MAQLAGAHPDDVDVQALAADALMNVTRVGVVGHQDRGARARFARRRGHADPRRRARDRGRTRNIPGVLHLYLHAMEMSAHPEAALPAADLLRGLVPDAGHLQHMPSHIDVLCGDYRSSVVANQVAVQADRRFVDRRGPVELLFAVPGTRSALRGLLGDVRGPVRGGAGGRRRARQAAHSRAARDRVTADGRLAGGVRAVADSRARSGSGGGTS